MIQPATPTTTIPKSIQDVPLEDINVAAPEIFASETYGHYFARLRREDPVHYCKASAYGPYWSATKYHDIVKVETNHPVFSSEKGGITLDDGNLGLDIQMFIAMDPPKHDEQRAVVSPAVGPENLMKLADGVRERTGRILDALPTNETFDWVDRVSVELTTQMLAILFDFPWEERRKLTHWSDTATSMTNYVSAAERQAGMAELQECAEYFMRLWQERARSEPRPDLISMLAHSPSFQQMSPQEFLGTLILLIVGGNDTTRNSMTGGLLALNKYPGEYRKLCENPALVESMIPEIIRWQTPVMSMRRTALEDTEVGGKTIRKGEKLVMWYYSGNRDEEVIERAEEFIIDRARPRQHLSFGFGIHRCVGNRVAELQLKTLWEEVLKRWPEPGQIEIMAEPVRATSYAIRNYKSMPVRINA
jgi:cytochrome P450